MQGCPSPVCSCVPAVSTHLLCKACKLISASKSASAHGQSVSKGTLFGSVCYSRVHLTDFRDLCKVCLLCCAPSSFEHLELLVSEQ